jgi:hypothetical protein
MARESDARFRDDKADVDDRKKVANRLERQRFIKTGNRRFQQYVPMKLCHIQPSSHNMYVVASGNLSRRAGGPTISISRAASRGKTSKNPPND